MLKAERIRKIQSPNALMVGSQGGRAWSPPLLLPRQTKLPWMQSCKHTDWDTVPTYAASSTSIPQLPMRKQKTIKECFSFIKLVGSESISESYREVSEEKCYRGGWRRRRSERLAEDLQAPMNWVTDGRWARGRGWPHHHLAVQGVYKGPVWLHSMSSTHNSRKKNLQCMEY